jgi:hypothetical protein
MTGMPDAMTRDLPLSTTAEANVSTARVSSAIAFGKSLKSPKARWMTPSDRAAPVRRLSG